MVNLKNITPRERHTRGHIPFLRNSRRGPANLSFVIALGQGSADRKKAPGNFME